MAGSPRGGGDLVGPRVAHHVEVPGGLAAGRGRQVDELAEPGVRIVAPRRAAPVGPAVEVRQLDAQDRRLQLVEAAVVADVLVGDLVLEPWKRSIRAASATSRRRS